MRGCAGRGHLARTSIWDLSGAHGKGLAFDKKLDPYTSGPLVPAGSGSGPPASRDAVA